MECVSCARGYILQERLRLENSSSGKLIQKLLGASENNPGCVSISCCLYGEGPRHDNMVLEQHTKQACEHLQNGYESQKV